MRMCDSADEGEGEEVNSSVFSPKIALMDSISSWSAGGIDGDDSWSILRAIVGEEKRDTDS